MTRLTQPTVIQVCVLTLYCYLIGHTSSAVIEWSSQQPTSQIRNAGYDISRLDNKTQLKVFLYAMISMERAEGGWVEYFWGGNFLPTIRMESDSLILGSVYSTTGKKTSFYWQYSWTHFAECIKNMSPNITQTLSYRCLTTRIRFS